MCFKTIEDVIDLMHYYSKKYMECLQHHNIKGFLDKLIIIFNAMQKIRDLFYRLHNNDLKAIINVLIFNEN